MGKRYVTPLSTIIELGTSSMLANSPTLGVTEDEVDAADTYSNRPSHQWPLEWQTLGRNEEACQLQFVEQNKNKH